MIRKSEHRDNQESKRKRQKGLQRLRASQNENGAGMLKILKRGFAQPSAPKPSDSSNKINENRDGQGQGQFPFPARFVEPSRKRWSKIEINDQNQIESNRRDKKNQA